MDVWDDEPGAWVSKTKKKKGREPSRESCFWVEENKP